jgi:hypothetical protein
VDAQLDVEVIRPAGEQVDQSRRGVLGEQAGRGHPQQPPPAAGLADLEDRPILQPQHLGRAAGQAQPTGGERDARRRADEQPVAELLAQLADVERHGRFGNGQVDRGLLDRAQPDNCGESSQLCRCHLCQPLVRVRAAAATTTQTTSRRGPSAASAIG